MFISFHIGSFARAGSFIAVATDKTSCAADGHCHAAVEFQDPHHNLNHHETDASDLATHEDGESHEHEHRHSPDEPVHSHPHQHSSFVHTHSVQFLSGTSYNLEISLITAIEFSTYEEGTFQGPFLDSLFRPPIA